MAAYSERSQEALTTMLDRWMGILKTIGVEGPFSVEAERSVALLSETGQRVVMHAPRRDSYLSDPILRDDLGYTNSIVAEQNIQGISHILRVSSSKDPWIEASQNGTEVEPLVTPQAMIDLCLRAEVVRP